MTFSFLQDAPASTVSPANLSVPSTALANQSPDPAELPPIPDGQIRHLLFGSPGSVRGAIAQLHTLNYAAASDWSRLLPTGRTNEVMAILTKRTRPTT